METPTAQGAPSVPPKASLEQLQALLHGIDAPAELGANAEEGLPPEEEGAPDATGVPSKDDVKNLIREVLSEMMGAATPAAPAGIPKDDSAMGQTPVVQNTALENKVDAMATSVNALTTALHSIINGEQGAADEGETGESRGTENDEAHNTGSPGGFPIDEVNNSGDFALLTMMKQNIRETTVL